jgi:xanthine dehydrogenase YagR molybdenum-binding subunit
MVYARLLVSPMPRARVKKLDLEAARKVPGVVAANALQEEPAWLGEPIAIVAAESVEAAEDGLRALAPQLEPLPWAVDHAGAARPDAPKVHKDGNLGKPETNGDEAKARAALKASAASITATYTVPIQHHACLETHGVVVDYRGGDEATVYCSTQQTTGFAEEAAKPLGLQAAKVHGVNEHMGGGFGGKFGLGFEGVAACKLSKELGRPVHLMLTRRDEFLMAGNRSGSVQTIELGCSAAGDLLGMVATSFKHGGLNAGSLAGQPYIYTVGDTYRAVRSVRMHLDGNRAMRAPGHPQASFAMESSLDELAYAAGLDLVEIRKRNLKGGDAFRSEAWKRQLDRAASEIGWADHPHKKKPGPATGTECIGIGFALANWGGGGRRDCEVEVKIEKDGSVSCSCGTQDLGTGTRTYMAAITAEEFGLPLAGVTARIGSSRYGNSVGSGGSVTTGSLAPAVKDAASNARALFADHLAKVMNLPAAGFRFLPEGVVNDQAKSPTVLTWAKACATLPAEGLRANGVWVDSLQASGAPGAQAARVAVDPGTGRVRVLHMVCVQAIGLPLNRLAVKSQIQGGMIQALGYALTEGRVIDPVLGLQMNPNFEEYKLPHALEIPKMTTILDEGDTRNAVVGVGEPAIIPGHGAIANAVANACGARVRELPITPDKVLMALGKVV